MRCPKNKLIRQVVLGLTVEEFGECHKADCAWWAEEKNACSVKVIALELIRVHFMLGDIAKSMPVPPLL